jgi:outer membrane protein assembly factor BamB
MSFCQEHSSYFYKNYFLNLEKLEKINITEGRPVFDENIKYVFIYGKGYREVTIFSKENTKKTASFRLEGTNRPLIDEHYLISSDTENFYIYDLKGNKIFTLPCRTKVEKEEYFYYQIVILKDDIFLTMPDNGLKIIKMKTKKEITPENKEKDIEQDINGRNLLFALDDGVLYIKDLDGKQGIIVYKYDSNGKVLFKTSIEHTDIEIKGNEHHYHRYLNYFTHNNKYLIFTTNVFEKKYNSTKIVDLKTGDVKEAKLIVSGILTDEKENLTGLLSLDDEKDILTLYDKFPGHIYSETTSALSYGNILAVAYYCRISTGSKLMALDINTGKLLWTAEVIQLMIPHSKYYNSVTLDRHGEKLLMAGYESGGTYFQVFDINNGKRLFEDTDKTW